MKIKLVHPNAKVPVRGTPEAAGFDLFSVDQMLVRPHERVVVGTGICIEFPKFPECGVSEEFYGQIAPRSGLAVKNGIMTMAGIIDTDYRGEIKVVLYNADPVMNFLINQGDRIAQLIFHKLHMFDFILVHELAGLSGTERGDGGFGSTGVK